MVVHERKPGSLIINTAGGQTPAYHYKRIKHWSDKTLVNMIRDIIFKYIYVYIYIYIYKTGARRISIFI